jgi:hypothetical protein
LFAPKLALAEAGPIGPVLERIGSVLRYFREMCGYFYMQVKHRGRSRRAQYNQFVINKIAVDHYACLFSARSPPYSIRHMTIDLSLSGLMTSLCRRFAMSLSDRRALFSSSQHEPCTSVQAVLDIGSGIGKLGV